MIDTAKLLKALNASVKKGWSVQGVWPEGDMRVDFINPRGKLVIAHFVEIEDGIRFTDTSFKNKEILVNESKAA